MTADICRICYTGNEEADSPLITPCRCAGSLKYVHQDCLEQWIKVSKRKSCELCKYGFIMETKMSPFSERITNFFNFYREIYEEGASILKILLIVDGVLVLIMYASFICAWYAGSLRVPWYSLCILMKVLIMLSYMNFLVIVMSVIMAIGFCINADAIIVVREAR